MSRLCLCMIILACTTLDMLVVQGITVKMQGTFVQDVDGKPGPDRLFLEVAQDSEYASYLGVGFNIFEADPLTVGVDEALGVVPLFDLTFDRNRTIKGLKIPDQATIKSQATCSYSKAVSTIDSVQGFESAFNAKFSVSGNVETPVGGAKGTVGGGLEKASKDLFEQNKVQILVSLNCKLYEGAIDPIVGLSSKFVDHARSTQRRNNWNDFLNYWGSHYTRKVDYGASYNKRATLTRDAYDTMRQTGATADLGVGASVPVPSAPGTTVGGEASVSGGYSSSSTTNIAASNMEVSIESAGVILRPDATVNQFADSIKNAPLAPLRYELIPITELFDLEFIPDERRDVTQAELNTWKEGFRKSYMNRLGTGNLTIGKVEDNIRLAKSRKEQERARQEQERLRQEAEKEARRRSNCYNIGTAPWCAGTCPQGFEQQSKFDAGCFVGWKVKCCEAISPMCYWIGSTPECRATSCPLGWFAYQTTDVNCRSGKRLLCCPESARR